MSAPARLHETIAISLGDPAGIGPEIVVRALAERPDADVTVFGDVGVLERAAKVAGVAAPDQRARPRRDQPGPG